MNQEVTTPKFYSTWLVVSGDKEDQLLHVDLMNSKDTGVMINISYKEALDMIEKPILIKTRLDHTDWITSDADVFEILSYIIRFKDAVNRR
tara:strand:- start:1886 stop:2158 length:273 start_codon:yes stop_codon:yes gene_type:complete